MGINDGYVAAWSAIGAPSGGMKESGMASRHGESGLTKYTASQNIVEQRFMSMRGPERLGRKTYATAMSTLLRLGKNLRILP